ncbi:Cof-type HAD-IIB family hydrolase [Ferviditalea candida]|uniref:Cof-type HAD-IIB family hydrolase n=1 Tax=Ferviditalea candida TaxID=3108399 RepID=A0ABU5ZCH8_9BACL|nr:Cof-type HAD-IIB family hydrolase [Paenibacillaceae bacterium T2]
MGSALKYRMIALDVDGTLLNDHYEITENTRRTIAQIHAEGCRIVLCTGRGPKNTLPLLEQLGVSGTAITHNGAVTIDGTIDKVLSIITIPTDHLAPLVGYCRERGMHFDVNSAFHLFVERLGAFEKEMYAKYLNSPIVLPAIEELPEPAVKLTMFGEPSVMDQAEKDWAGSGKALRMTRSGDFFIDFMEPEATKGAALRKLAGMWGIPRESIMAIGNYFNDLEMLEYAGLGIAMQNSPEEVKSRADAVTASNNHDGVHQAIVRYMYSQA